MGGNDAGWGAFCCWGIPRVSIQFFLLYALNVDNVCMLAFLLQNFLRSENIYVFNLNICIVVS